MFSRFFEEKKASNDNKIENKILGDGAYGCVITPPITKDILKEYIEYKNPEPTDVGKLFKPSSHSRNYFDLELKIAKGVNDAKWNLVTGDKKQIYTLARKSYLAAKNNPYDAFDLIHTENFVLVDTKKRIRGFYDGTDPEAIKKLLEDIKILKLEE